MDFKKNLVVLLVLGIALISITGVSAGLFDFLSDENDTTVDDSNVVSEPSVTIDDTLKKSSIKLQYTKPVKSTTYAYFYEDTGAFAEDAYWAPWSFKATLKIDIEKLFEYEFGPNSNYTLDMFKKDIKYMIKHDDIKISAVDLSSGYILPINSTYTTAKLKGNTLTVKCDYTDEEYHYKSIKETIKHIKKAKTTDLDVDFNKNFKHKYKTGDSYLSYTYHDLQVKVSKMS